MIKPWIETAFIISDNQNISLFLGSDFHHVIYPVNPSGDLNFIAIMKYKLSIEEQKNYSQLNDNSSYSIKFKVSNCLKLIWTL